MNKKVVIVIVIIGGVTLAWTKSYPVMLVGTNVILAYEVDKSLKLAVNLDQDVSKKLVADQIIKNKKSEILLKKLEIAVTQEVIRDEWLFYIQGKNEEYLTLINNYFQSDEELFGKYVVYPAVLEAQLRIKYNSTDLNAFAYTQDILDQINQGGKFEELAKSYSDDKISGQLGGDLGFFEKGEMLQELERAIIEASLSEVSKKIVVSRYGYHIVYPMETAEKDGKKLWHAKHILIKTSGFEEWFNKQIEDIRVWRFARI